MSNVRGMVRRYIAMGLDRRPPKPLSKKAKLAIAERRRIGDAKLAEAMRRAGRSPRENSAQQPARSGEAGQTTATTYDGRAKDW